MYGARRGVRIARPLDNDVISQGNFKPLAMEFEYTRGSLVNLSSSSSLIHNNLCVARGLKDQTSISYGVVHKATANIAHVSEGGETVLKEVDYEPSKDKDPMAYITQVSC